MSYDENSSVEREMNYYEKMNILSEQMSLSLGQMQDAAQQFDESRREFEKLYNETGKAHGDKMQAFQHIIEKHDLMRTAQAVPVAAEAPVGKDRW